MWSTLATDMLKRSLCSIKFRERFFMDDIFIGPVIADAFPGTGVQMAMISGGGRRERRRSQHARRIIRFRRLPVKRASLFTGIGGPVHSARWSVGAWDE